MWIVFESRDGSSTLLSEKFGVTYHSKYGALQESRHVFIQEGLHYKCIRKKKLSILEMGFGTGLNALLTYIQAQKFNLEINYTAIEKFPISMDVVEELNYCSALNFNETPCVYKALHAAPWEEAMTLHDNFSFKKIKQSIEDFELEESYDLIYYDAFAPNVQPELWEEPLLQKMYNALLPNGALVTYCAKGVFKRTLKAVGFKVETLKGPPGKREMVRAVKKINAGLSFDRF